MLGLENAPTAADLFDARSVRRPTRSPAKPLARQAARPPSRSPAKPLPSHAARPPSRSPAKPDPDSGAGSVNGRIKLGKAFANLIGRDPFRQVAVDPRTSALFPWWTDLAYVAVGISFVGDHGNLWLGIAGWTFATVTFADLVAHGRRRHCSRCPSRPDQELISPHRRAAKQRPKNMGGRYALKV
ncbi:hypothetical protein [Actinoplanes sp. M2I2]|uniref:hypothetical protein n=1 Tax=Actinoplanes sp. M2I2 TaxID=1734444 RepID=UPI0020207688|nr:hypothetical protein [Actinoplanes sp. M2I2]